MEKKLTRAATIFLSITVLALISNLNADDSSKDLTIDGAQADYIFYDEEGNPYAAEQTIAVEEDEGEPVGAAVDTEIVDKYGDAYEEVDAVTADDEQASDDKKKGCDKKKKKKKRCSKKKKGCSMNSKKNADNDEE